MPPITPPSHGERGFDEANVARVAQGDHGVCECFPYVKDEMPLHLVVQASWTCSRPIRVSSSLRCPMRSCPSPPFAAILSRAHCPNLRKVEPDACVSNGARLAHCLTRFSNSELPQLSPPCPSFPQVAFRVLPYSSRRRWWCRARSACSAPSWASSPSSGAT